MNPFVPAGPSWHAMHPEPSKKMRPVSALASDGVSESVLSRRTCGFGGEDDVDEPFKGRVDRPANSCFLDRPEVDLKQIEVVLELGLAWVGSLFPSPITTCDAFGRPAHVHSFQIQRSGWFFVRHRCSSQSYGPLMKNGKDHSLPTAGQITRGEGDSNFDAEREASGAVSGPQCDSPVLRGRQSTCDLGSRPPVAHRERPTGSTTNQVARPAEAR